MKRFFTFILAIVLCFGIQTQAFAATDDIISTKGIGGGDPQSGWSDEMKINLSEGGNNGSVVFRIYGDSSVDVHFWVKDPNGKTVTPSTYINNTAIHPNGGNEQTIYFKAGCKAPAGTYTLKWSAYGTSSITINAWICSW